jgi:hypothetical protein
MTWNNGNGDNTAAAPPAPPQSGSTSGASDTSDTPNTPSGVAPPHNPHIPEFFGLPAQGFCLSEQESITAMCRIWAANSLSCFFRDPQFTPATFVFVRVLETEQQSRSNDWNDWIEQTSTLQLLSTVRGIVPTETFTLHQSTSGYRTTVGGPTALLREGGVYLLPLWRGEEDWQHEWYNMSEIDVLFEVDDNGMIWSHSPFPHLNKYDGRPALELAQAIVDITEDADFEIAVTWFGRTGAEPELLTFGEMTALSASESFNNWGMSEYSYTLLTENGEEITARSHVANLFEIGGRYLVFIYNFDGDFYINAGDTARINADGTITPIRNADINWSIFDDFDGYTVEQLFDIVRRAAAFYDRF